MIDKLGVVGGGLMGSGIAEVAARSGVHVVVVEVNDDSAKRAAERIESSLYRAAERGKISGGLLEAALDNIVVSSSARSARRSQTCG